MAATVLAAIFHTGAPPGCGTRSSSTSTAPPAVVMVSKAKPATGKPA